jgi:hypothetical protein
LNFQLKNISSFGALLLSVCGGWNKWRLAGFFAISARVAGLPNLLLLIR